MDGQQGGKKLSRITLSGNPSGTGNFTLASPNSNTDRTLTLPDLTGVVLTNTQFTNDASVSSSGYQKLPSGLIIQWGDGVSTATAGSGNYTATITFPIAFPTACFQVTLSAAGADSPSLQFWATTAVQATTTTSFTAILFKGTTNGAWASKYIAIGY